MRNNNRKIILVSLTPQNTTCSLALKKQKIYVVRREFRVPSEKYLVQDFCFDVFVVAPMHNQVFLNFLQLF